MKYFIAGSSKGRTALFESACGGSIPSPAVDYKWVIKRSGWTEADVYINKSIAGWYWPVRDIRHATLYVTAEEGRQAMKDLNFESFLILVKFNTVTNGWEEVGSDETDLFVFIQEHRKRLGPNEVVEVDCTL